MWNDWWTIPLGIVGGLVLVWAVLVAALWLTKPGDYDLKEALRLLPDLIRLIKRLAADPDTPRGLRIRLALLLAYLALPFDLIPDFVPVLGYADDAIIVALDRRSPRSSAQRRWCCARRREVPGPIPWPSTGRAHRRG